MNDIDSVKIMKKWTDTTRNWTKEQQVEAFGNLVYYGLYGGDIPTSDDDKINMFYELVAPQVMNMQNTYAKINKHNKAVAKNKKSLYSRKAAYQGRKRGMKVPELNRILGAKDRQLYSNEGWKQAGAEITAGDMLDHSDELFPDDIGLDEFLNSNSSKNSTENGVEKFEF